MRCQALLNFLLLEYDTISKIGTKNSLLIYLLQGLNKGRLQSIRVLGLKRLLYVRGDTLFTDYLRVFVACNVSNFKFDTPVSTCLY